MSNPGTPVIRRLTDFEYDNTLADLLGIAPKYGTTFPPDDRVNGFDDNAAALTVPPLYTDKARAAAEDIAATVSLGKLEPCGAANGDASCAAKLIQSFGARAFRRPLTAAEQQRYGILYGAVATNEGFDGGARAVVAAMLQSPNFLYRTELGVPDATGASLTPYEIASELSYMLTGSMPDDALFAAAASGALANRDVIAAQAKRLLALDKSRVVLEHFARQWLKLDLLEIAVKDPVVYPAYSPALRDAMYAETVAFFTNTMRKDGATLSELLKGDTTWASDPLAQFYGLGAPIGPVDSTGLRPYKLPSGRSGLLTQASILSAEAKPDRPSPVHRGKLVRERFFCQALPPPPPGVNTNLASVSPNASNRDRFLQHSQDPKCAGCHQLMDPIGFGFEGFDGIGRAVPPPVDTSGTVVGTASTNGGFNGVADLAARLAVSADVEQCFALEWYRFAYGVDDNPDSCAVQSVVAGFRAGGLGLQSLLVSLAQTDHFVRRAADADSSLPTPLADDAGAGADGVATGPGAADGAVPAADVAQVTVHTDTSWVGGYCQTVTVANMTSASLMWTASLPAKGMVTSVWNATATTIGSTWVFVGVDFNRSLAAGASTQFGLCAKD
jgi:hypothetical protein